eukprot:SAG22_NODE_313_length_12610_cov_5.778275_9_plen_79_part_00
MHPLTSTRAARRGGSDSDDRFTAELKQLLDDRVFDDVTLVAGTQTDPRPLAGGLGRFWGWMARARLLSKRCGNFQGEF